MTFHAYFQYVCLFIVWLCAISPTRMYAQKYRQQSDTHRTLLVVDKETGRPIEGAYILLENQPLASSTGGRIIIPWKTNSKDTVLVQSLGYKSQYIYLSKKIKKDILQAEQQKVAQQQLRQQQFEAKNAQKQRKIATQLKHSPLEGALVATPKSSSIRQSPQGFFDNQKNVMWLMIAIAVILAIMVTAYAMLK